MLNILIKLLPLLIPFLLLFLLFIRNRKAQNIVSEMPLWEVRLWNWTLLLSTIASVFILLWVAVTSESNINSTYIPTQYIDGKIIPSQIIPHKTL